MRNRNAWFIVACLLVLGALAAPALPAGAAGGSAASLGRVPCPNPCLVCPIGYSCGRDSVGCLVCLQVRRSQSRTPGGI